MACIERALQRYFSPVPPAWQKPLAFEGLDLLVKRRFRYLALIPLTISIWGIGSCVAAGSASPTRLGSILGGGLQTAVLVGFSRQPASFEKAAHLTHFLLLFLMFSLSALPLLSYMLTQSCDVIHVNIWVIRNNSCALRMWDLLFASAFVGGTATALQASRRLETAVLLQLMAPGAVVAAPPSKGRTPRSAMTEELLLAAPPAEVINRDVAVGAAVTMGVLVRVEGAGTSGLTHIYREGNQP